jgi:hypothetical protein
MLWICGDLFEEKAETYLALPYDLPCQANTSFEEFKRIIEYSRIRFGLIEITKTEDAKIIKEAIVRTPLLGLFMRQKERIEFDIACAGIRPQMGSSPILVIFSSDLEVSIKG